MCEQKKISVLRLINLLNTIITNLMISNNVLFYMLVSKTNCSVNRLINFFVPFVEKNSSASFNAYKKGRNNLKMKIKCFIYEKKQKKIKINFLNVENDEKLFQLRFVKALVFLFYFQFLELNFILK